MLKECTICSRSYKVKPSQAAKSLYCSVSCKHEGQKIGQFGNRNPNYRDGGLKTCQTCGIEFKNYNREAKYCSDICKGNAPKNIARISTQNYKGGPATVVCKTCGVSFTAKLSARRKFCTYKCAKENPMRRRLSSVDHNHKDIVGVLHDVGASVMDTSDIGSGFPDLVVGFRGVVYLLEVKNQNTYYGRKGLNKNQQEWSALWAGPAPIVVYTTDEALKAIGAI